MNSITDEDTSIQSMQYRHVMYQDVLSGSPVIKGWCRVIWHRFWWMCSRSDTKPAKFMLALSSTFWAVLLALPGDTMTRPVYIYMAQVGAPYSEIIWIGIWTTVSVGLWWRLFSASEHRLLSLTINAFACVTFLVTCIAIFASRTYPIPAGIASDIANAIAAAWVLVRTHIHQGPGWHND